MFSGYVCWLSDFRVMPLGFSCIFPSRLQNGYCGSSLLICIQFMKGMGRRCLTFKIKKIYIYFNCQVKLHIFVTYNVMFQYMNKYYGIAISSYLTCRLPHILTILGRERTLRIYSWSKFQICNLYLKNHYLCIIAIQMAGFIWM